MEKRWDADGQEEWMAHIVKRRADGCELLLLAQDDAGTIWGVGRDPHPGAEDEWWGIAPKGALPRPSVSGIGEWIHMQEQLAHQEPPVLWDPADHVERKVRGKGIFRYPLGPVHADVAESMRYDLAAMGDEIIHLSLRHDFKPRHVATLCQGQSVGEALRIVERMTGTSSFSHQWAFMQAVERAAGTVVPAAVLTYRMVAHEMERLYSHLGDLATLASSTGLPVAQMDYLHLKEKVLRCNAQLFGDRYLRGALQKGYCEGDVGAAAADVLHAAESAESIAHGLLHTPSFLDRLVGAGKIPGPVCDFIRPVGPVGRAAGRACDVRPLWDYGAYAAVSFSVPVLSQADSYARFMVKVAEVASSANIIRRLLPMVPHSPARDSQEDPGLFSGKGIGVVEAPRGLLVYGVWVEGDGQGGRVQKVAVATPSARNWHVVPPAMANSNILQDFPIIDASFLLSVSGWDQ